MAEDEPLTTDEPQDAAPDAAVTEAPAEEQPKSDKSRKAGKKQPLRRFKVFFKRQSKPKQVLMALAALLVVLLALPWTRYPLLGLGLKRSVALQVLDSQSHTPVSDAKVTIDGKTGQTDGKGLVTVYGIKVGKAKASITKQYYTTVTQDVFVGLLGHKTASANLEAAGRPVKVTALNKITKQPVANVTLTAGQSTAKTDDKGLATLIIDPTLKEVTIIAKTTGYNDGSNKVTLNLKGDSTADLSLVPAGKIYFLSKLSGTIDVVRTNLDGSGRETVLAGTGHEEEQGTVLLASRDWKYLALQATRDTDSNDNKIYLIDTTDNNKLSTIDEGDADFTFDGWLDDNLIYQVDRNDLQTWQSDRSRLKAFNATAKNITILDKATVNDHGGCSTGYGYSVPHCYAYQFYNGVTITDDEVLFAKSVNTVYVSPEGQIGVYAVKPDNTGRRTIFEQTYDGHGLYDYATYKPTEIDYGVGNDYYEYELGGKPEKIDQKQFSDNQSKYLNFVVSPDGKSTFWAESRDGKNTLFVGDLDLANGKQVGNLSELKPYGWFTGDYLLLSKNGSELYIMSSRGGEPLKVSDYHKPNVSYNGYGYGYGGN